MQNDRPPEGPDAHGDRARQGTMLGRMRYVLGIGVVLAIVALAISFLGA